MSRAEAKSTATRRRPSEVPASATFADLTRGDEWENPFREQSPEPCERFAALLEVIATQRDDPLCGPRARRSGDVELFLERLGWESFACWVGSARGAIRGVQARGLAAGVVEKIRAVDKLMLSLALSASRCPGGSEIDAFDDYVDDDLWQASEGGLQLEPFAPLVEEINREEDDLVRYLAYCAQSLRAFAAEIKSAPARVVVVTGRGATMTIHDAWRRLAEGTQTFQAFKRSLGLGSDGAPRLAPDHPWYELRSGGIGRDPESGKLLAAAVEEIERAFRGAMKAATEARVDTLSERIGRDRKRNVKALHKSVGRMHGYPIMKRAKQADTGT